MFRVLYRMLHPISPCLNCKSLSADVFRTLQGVTVYLSVSVRMFFLHYRMLHPISHCLNCKSLSADVFRTLQDVTPHFSLFER